MTAVLGHEVGHKLLRGCNGSVWEAFAEWLSSRALRAAGYAQEAQEKINRHLADFRAADPQGTALDIANPQTDIKQRKACQGKWIWIMSQLCEKHGDTFVRDYVTALRNNTRPAGSQRKLVARQANLRMRDHVAALSKAAGEDLTAWFTKLGITVGE